MAKLSAENKEANFLSVNRRKLVDGKSDLNLCLLSFSLFYFFQVSNLEMDACIAVGGFWSKTGSKKSGSIYLKFELLSKRRNRNGFKERSIELFANFEEVGNKTGEKKDHMWAKMHPAEHMTTKSRSWFHFIHSIQKIDKPTKLEICGKHCFEH